MSGTEYEARTLAQKAANISDLDKLMHESSHERRKRSPERFGFGKLEMKAVYVLRQCRVS